jgi:hypothetical protein
LGGRRLWKKRHGAEETETKIPSVFSKEKIVLKEKSLNKKNNQMKEPGLDGRHRDKNDPKAGEIQQKRGDTLNKNLPQPIPEFSPNARLDTMRKETGEISIENVRRAARNRK